MSLRNFRLEAFLKAWSFLADAHSVLSLELKAYRKMFSTLNRFYKLPVGQAPSLDEAGSFRKL